MKAILGDFNDKLDITMFALNKYFTKSPMRTLGDIYPNDLNVNLWAPMHICMHRYKWAKGLRN